MLWENRGASTENRERVRVRVWGLWEREGGEGVYIYIYRERERGEYWEASFRERERCLSLKILINLSRLKIMGCTISEKAKECG